MSKVKSMAIALNIEQKLDREISSFLKIPAEGKVKQKTNKKLTFEEFLSDKMMIIKAIREGIPYALFDLIQQYVPFSESDWAEYLDVSTKSLQRYKAASKPFRPIHSEKIIEIAEVSKAGIETFGSPDKFNRWLNTPSFALGRLKPIELLKNSYGKDLVLGELIRIDHGIFV
jgi:putative toxin-antitoxin system antitoxin component (TIGR02293 family)